MWKEEEVETVLMVEVLFLLGLELVEEKNIKLLKNGGLGKICDM